MSDGKLLIGTLSLVPKKALSRGVRGLVQVRSAMAVRRFAAKFGIDLAEAEHPVERYGTILELFTRRLKPGVRPLDPDPRALLSPVDAKLDVYGKIEGGRLVQAKGREYTLAALLGDEALAARYEGGSFATLYLSPKDYHRIHSPASGRVLGYTYVPGELWPVNAAAVRHVDSLFARNERVITHLETAPFGRMEVVMVGATNVGHMTLAYDEALRTNVGAKEVVRRAYDAPLALERGAELGVFEMGSTVILVLEPKVALDPIPMGSFVRMGTRLGLTA